METNLIPMEKLPQSGFKRKIQDEEILNSKKLKTKNGDESASISLTNLPEDVLLIILSNLDCHDLSELNQTCTLFSRLCSDFTLWRNVNCSYKYCSESDMNYISSNVHEDTKKINIRGPCSETASETDLLNNLWLSKVREKCPKLEELSIPYHSFDCQLITIFHFPPTLIKLDLSNTILKGSLIGKSYFKDIYKLLPNLKFLILSNCSWFEPHSLMAISKCIKLEELRINDCMQVHDCLAYCGLSTRAGFRNLKTLDLRRCSISNSELICFSSVCSLKNIYLEFNEESTISINRALAAMFFDKTPAHWYENDAPAEKLRIEKLVVRNYKILRDEFFCKFVMSAQYLKYVDITGSNVTRCAINSIKQHRPDLKVVCE